MNKLDLVPVPAEPEQGMVPVPEGAKQKLKFDEAEWLAAYEVVMGAFEVGDDEVLV